ncbi:MAG: flagellar hook-length control protein FliK, partial [Peptococcaceae bacterium]|nr:flagellar hook-length control protein FliK [Peptococcaceae bacterium]
PGGVELADLRERLVQEFSHIFAVRKGAQTRVQLRLEPEHLGELTIRLFFSKGEMSAHFFTGNSYVKDILEGSIQQLREVLGQQDIRLGEALVFAGGGGEGTGDMGRYSGEKNGQAAPYGGYRYRRHGDAPLEQAGTAAAEAVAARVNYLV